MLHIQEVFELLVEEQAQIDNLNARYGVHPLSIKLKPMREKLLLEVSKLKLALCISNKRYFCTNIVRYYIYICIHCINIGSDE